MLLVIVLHWRIFGPRVENPFSAEVAPDRPNLSSLSFPVCRQDRRQRSSKPQVPAPAHIAKSRAKCVASLRGRERPGGRFPRDRTQDRRGIRSNSCSTLIWKLVPSDANRVLRRWWNSLRNRTLIILSFVASIAVVASGSPKADQPDSMSRRRNGA